MNCSMYIVNSPLSEIAGNWAGDPDSEVQSSLVLLVYVIYIYIIFVYLVYQDDIFLRSSEYQFTLS